MHIGVKFDFAYNTRTYGDTKSSSSIKSRNSLGIFSAKTSRLCSELWYLLYSNCNFRLRNTRAQAKTHQVASAPPHVLGFMLCSLHRAVPTLLLSSGATISIGWISGRHSVVQAVALQRVLDRFNLDVGDDCHLTRSIHLFTQIPHPSLSLLSPSFLPALLLSVAGSTSSSLTI